MYRISKTKELKCGDDGNEQNISTAALEHTAFSVCIEQMAVVSIGVGAWWCNDTMHVPFHISFMWMWMQSE